MGILNSLIDAFNSWHVGRWPAQRSCTDLRQDGHYMATPHEDAPPPFEHFTCATGHLAAERALRIIEKATMLGESVNSDMIEHIEHLADKAGPVFARKALSTFNDEVPF